MIKRRTVAGAVCDDGRVFLNGRVAKAHSEVKPQDRLTLLFGDKSLSVTVLAVPDGPVLARSASDLYQIDISPDPPASHSSSESPAARGGEVSKGPAAAKGAHGLDIDER